MRLPISNSSSRTLSIFVEPLCDEYEVPIGGKAIIDLSDNDPHSIEIADTCVIIYDEGIDAVVEILTKDEQKVEDAISFFHGWYFSLAGRDSANTIDESIKRLEGEDGYLNARAKVFSAFYDGFKIKNSESPPENDILPAWAGEKSLESSYRAGGTAAYLNHVARSEDSFPGPGIGPLDTDVAHSKLEDAMMIIKDLKSRKTG